MNKKIAFMLFLLGGALSFTSCSKEDSDVFVGVDAIDEQRQQLIDRIKELPEIPTGLKAEDAVNTKYEKMDPETYTERVTNDEARIYGYYGYVDLGLSVKWCSSNIASPSKYNENVSFDAIFKEQQELRKIVPVEKPTIDVRQGTLPTIMSYEEYLKYLDVASLEKQVEKYEEYCKDMQSAYEGALYQYNNQQYDHHQYLYEPGHNICWGQLSDWSYNANSEKDSPENIGGNKDYDMSTYCLGDGWRLPTKAEWKELVDKCNWQEGKDGKYWLITGPSGKQIVLYSNGYKYNTAERANVSTGVSSLYDVFIFNPKTKSTEQVEGHYQKALIRPVYTK